MQGHIHSCSVVPKAYASSLTKTDAVRVSGGLGRPDLSMSAMAAVLKSMGTQHLMRIQGFKITSRFHRASPVAVTVHGCGDDPAIDDAREGAVPAKRRGDQFLPYCGSRVLCIDALGWDGEVGLQPVSSAEAFELETLDTGRATAKTLGKGRVSFLHTNLLGVGRDSS